MNGPTLFDEPEARFMDATSFGDLKEVFVTDRHAVLLFERGKAHISPEAFFSLSRVLSRKTTA